MTKAESVVAWWTSLCHRPPIRSGGNITVKGTTGALRNTSGRTGDSGLEVIQPSITDERPHSSEPLVRSFHCLRGRGSLNVAMKAYHLATDEEKNKIKKEMRIKLVLARFKPEEWNAETKRLAMEHFRMQPNRSR